MLIRFTVENFLSFKERVEFSMIPGKGRKLSHHLIKREKPKDISVLKTGVLYGANAAGKSNVIKAIDFAKQLITKGTSPDKTIPIKPFKLEEAYLKKPSRFEFEFKQNGQTYANEKVFVIDELERSLNENIIIIIFNAFPKCEKSIDCHHP